MIDYASSNMLFVNLRNPSNHAMHWFNTISWIFVEFMYSQLQSATIITIQFAQFITCSSDEVTIVDNNSWIYVHAYVVDCWTREKKLVCVYKIVDVLGSNNFIELIMNAMWKGGGLTKEDLFKKFLCFGVDEMNVFQHGKTNVTKQIKILWHLFPWVPLCCS